MSTTTAPSLSKITVPIKLDLEKRDQGSLRLSGTAVPYNSESKFIGFYEVIAPGAFRSSLGGASDLLLLWQHDMTQPLAREKAGNLEVRDSPAGIVFKADLPDTVTARNAVALVRAGVVDQMSFGFRVTKDRWEERGGRNVRIVEEGEIRELSLVTSPAYAATDVSARSMEQRIIEAVRQQRLEQITTRKREVYGPGSQFSYFRDLLTTASAYKRQSELMLQGQPLWSLQSLADQHFVHGGADEARDRLLTLEHRATNTTGAGAGGGFIPTGVPAYVASAFADAARNVGVLPSVMRVDPLPPVGMVVKEPKLTTGSSVGVQANELDVASSTALVEALESEPVVTIVGYNDASRQLVDRSDPGIDAVLARELGRAYGAKLDSQILTGAGSSGEMTGLLVVSGTTAESYTDSSPTQAEAWPTIMKLYGDVATTFGIEPDLLLLHPRRMAWLLNWKDTATAQVEINWPAGLTVQTVPSMPTTRGAGTNEDAIIVLRRAEVPLFLDTPRFMVDPNTLAHQHEVRFVAYNYCALASSRQPAAIGTLTGTGLQLPTFS
jgi:HK97 family phage prohead protease